MRENIEPEFILNNMRRPVERGFYLVIDSVGSRKVCKFDQGEWQIDTTKNPIVSWYEGDKAGKWQ